MNFLDRPFDFIGSERTMKNPTMYANPIQKFDRTDGHHYIVPTCILCIATCAVLLALGVIAL